MVRRKLEEKKLEVIDFINLNNMKRVKLKEIYSLINRGAMELDCK